LTWDDALAAPAQSWANGCVFERSGPGENLAAGTGDFDAAAAAQSWVDEWEWTSYGPNNPEPSLLMVPPGKNPSLSSFSVKLKANS